MSYKKAIFTNTLYQLFAKLLSTFSTLFLSFLITRFLGAQTWGEYVTVISFITFFYAFCEFGLNSIGAREFSKSQSISKSDFYNFLIVRVINTILVLFLALLALYFLDYPEKIRNGILISFFGIFFFSMSSAFNAAFQAKLKYRFLFFTTAVASLTSITLVLLFFQSIYSNFYLLFVIMVIADFVRFVSSGYFAIKLLSPGRVFASAKLIKYYFLSALPLGGALVFNTLMVQIDRIMLSKMGTSLELGYYALSYKIFDIILVIPTFFMNSAFSVFVKKHSESGDFSENYSRSYYLLFTASIFVTLLTFILSPFLIPFIWGEAMTPSVLTLNILVSGSLFFYLSSPVSWTFVVENKQKILLWVYLVGFLLNFCLNLYAISVYSYLGAAVVTLITELYVLLCLEFLRKKYLKVKLLSPFSLKWTR